MRLLQQRRIKMSIITWLIFFMLPQWFVIMSAQSVAYQCNVNKVTNDYCLSADLVSIKSILGYAKPGDKDYDAWVNILKEKKTYFVN